MIRSVIGAALSLILLASCSQNNVTEEDSLGKYFDAAGVHGSLGIFDNGQGHFTIYNLRRFRDSAYLPAASFDIIQSLIAIQTGVAASDSALISDTVSLRKAFQTSNDSAFIRLAGRIGKDTMKKWVDSLGYGNKQIGSSGSTFWLDNQLTITSDEQLGLIKKLYFDQLPFFARPQQVTVKMMLTEANSNYKLVYKTAIGTRADGHRLGWVLGWIEENKHPYFFVLNLESADPSKDLLNNGLTILHQSFQQLGFFQGKK